MISSWTKLSAGLLLGLLCSGCAVHMNQKAEINAASFELDRVEENIVYTQPGWPEPKTADLYLPQKPGPHPVVLMIHGGGWANRSREDMTGVSEDLAERGYAVLNVNYRFAPYHRHPAQLLDMQQALIWIRDNASAYDFDTDRINSWGYSSGAHLAAMIASFDPERLPSLAQDDLPRIRAVVGGGIPADLTRYDDSPIIKRFIGGTLAEMPERYAEASPMYHVSADDPPVFLYHGKLDTLVRQSQSEDYFNALQAAGVEAEYYRHNWYGHMSMFLFGGEAEQRAIDFLDRHNRFEDSIATQ